MDCNRHCFVISRIARSTGGIALFHDDIASGSDGNASHSAAIPEMSGALASLHDGIASRDDDDASVLSCGLSRSQALLENAGKIRRSGERRSIVHFISFQSGDWQHGENTPLW